MQVIEPDGDILWVRVVIDQVLIGLAPEKGVDWASAGHAGVMRIDPHQWLFMFFFGQWVTVLVLLAKYQAIFDGILPACLPRYSVRACY